MKLETVVSRLSVTSRAERNGFTNVLRRSAAIPLEDGQEVEAGRREMTLFDQGWTEEHAKGLLDCLRLTGGVPHWKPEHLKKLQEWCSDHGKDYKSIEGQLDFVAYELRNAHQDIGMALRRAKTVDEARSAAEPYVTALREDREWFLAFNPRPDKGRQR